MFVAVSPANNAQTVNGFAFSLFHA
jgi:hypothetical protein